MKGSFFSETKENVAECDTLITVPSFWIGGPAYGQTYGAEPKQNIGDDARAASPRATNK